jgi:hypothetical protein
MLALVVFSDIFLAIVLPPLREAALPLLLGCLLTASLSGS